MVKLNERQQQTFKYLSIATLFCWTLLYLSKDSSLIGFAIIGVPFIFGISLYYSNRDYLRNTSIALILLLFTIAYLWGTLPFYSLGSYLLKSVYLNWVGGCMAAFVLVLAITKLALRGIKVGLLQVLLLIFLPFVCILLLAYLKGQPIRAMESYMLDRYDLVVLLYESFMTLIIVSSMSDYGKANNNSGAKSETT